MRTLDLRKALSRVVAERVDAVRSSPRASGPRSLRAAALHHASRSAALSLFCSAPPRALAVSSFSGLSTPAPLCAHPSLVHVRRLSRSPAHAQPAPVDAEGVDGELAAHALCELQALYSHKDIVRVLARIDDRRCAAPPRTAPFPRRPTHPAFLSSLFALRSSLFALRSSLFARRSSLMV